MKKIEIMGCEDCPHFQWYDGYEGSDNVYVCEKLNRIIHPDPYGVEKDCPLEDA